MLPGLLQEGHEEAAGHAPVGGEDALEAVVVLCGLIEFTDGVGVLGCYGMAWGVGRGGGEEGVRASVRACVRACVCSPLVHPLERAAEPGKAPVEELQARELPALGEGPGVGRQLPPAEVVDVHLGFVCVCVGGGVHECGVFVLDRGGFGGGGERD